MSPISPASLKRRSTPTIESDLACAGCGYQLKGLPLGGVCPECGAPYGVAGAPESKIPRYADAIVAAPRLWLAGFALGCTLLFVGYVGMFLFLGGLLVFDPLCAIIGILNWTRYDTAAPKFGLALFSSAAAVLWCTGVFLATQPRPLMPSTHIPPKNEWRALRWSSRLSQFFWIGVGVPLAYAWYQLTRSRPPSGAPFLFASVCLLPASVGLFPLSVYLANIAYWCEDELGEKFRNCAWMVGAATFFGVVSVVNTLTNAVLVGGIWALLIYLCFVFFVFSPAIYLLRALFLLQSAARWALTNNAIAVGKQKRLRAAAARNARIGPAPATSRVEADGPIALAADSSVNPEDAAPIPIGPKDAEANKRPQPAEASPYDLDTPS